MLKVDCKTRLIVDRDKPMHLVMNWVLLKVINRLPIGPVTVMLTQKWSIDAIVKCWLDRLIMQPLAHSHADACTLPCS